MKARPPSPAGGRRVDLHVHTHFSDGALSPEEVVLRAHRRGLAGVAITDHDTLEGLEPARRAAGSTIELVPGIEISSTLSGADVHILGYYVDPEHPELTRRLKQFQGERQTRATEMVARLKDLGMVIDLDAIQRQSGPGVLGRPHIARVMVDEGWVESVDEAFRRYIGRDGPAYVPRPAFRPDEAIGLIHAAGGVSVLAHPGEMPESLVADMATAGLRGIEVWHPRHGFSVQRYVRQLADKLGLIETGGSDFHGGERGIEIGEVAVSVAVLSRLKALAGVPG